MGAHDMGSWLIALTYVTVTGYLIHETRPSRALPWLGCFTNAMLLCFGGLLFTGVITRGFRELEMPLTDDMALATLVVLGTALALGIRHLWVRHLWNRGR